jgi:hypothetical protein
VPLVYILQANGVVNISWFVSSLVYFGVLVAFIWAFLSWEEPAKLGQKMQGFICALLSVGIVVLAIKGVSNEYRNEHPKSVLSFDTVATNISYPNGFKMGGIEWRKDYGQVDFTINNPEGDALQNLSVTIHVDDGSVYKIGQYTSVPGVEFSKAGLSDLQMRFSSTNKKTGEKGPTATFDIRDTALARIAPAAQWTIFCPRLEGKTYIRMVLATTSKAGIPDPKSIDVVGSYEFIASKGSRVVKVSATVPIAK